MQRKLYQIKSSALMAMCVLPFSVFMSLLNGCVLACSWIGIQIVEAGACIAPRHAYLSVLILSNKGRA
jgi:hypothetical protein